MKKQILTALAVLAIGVSAQASAYINGDIQFSGTAPLSAANDFTPSGLAAANSVDVASGVQVTGVNGVFDIFVDVNDTFTVPAFQFDPSAFFANFINSIGGFKADLIVWGAPLQNGNSLSLLGDAVFTGNGYAATQGQISLAYTKTSQSDLVSFSGTLSAFGTESQLPDAGGTLALLGIAVIGFALLPRSKMA